MYEWIPSKSVIFYHFTGYRFHGFFIALFWERQCRWAAQGWLVPYSSSSGCFASWSWASHASAGKWTKRWESPCFSSTLFSSPFHSGSSTELSFAQFKKEQARRICLQLIERTWLLQDDDYSSTSYIGLQVITRSAWKMDEVCLSRLLFSLFVTTCDVVKWEKKKLLTFFIASAC